MATIKSYTDIEQSKVLATILPLESADMLYIKREINDTFIEVPIVKPIGDVWKSLPCWSLTALLDVLPSGYEIVKNYHSLYFVESRDHGKSTNIFNNPVDACVTTIEKLHDLNLL